MHANSTGYEIAHTYNISNTTKYPKRDNREVFTAVYMFDT
jgi:hypothetical protein